MRTGTTQHGKRRRGAIVAVLATVGLCLGLQPCGVAAVSDNDCRHCPSEDGRLMPSGHDHGKEDSKPADCGGAKASCCDTVASTIDGRLQLKKIQHGDTPDLTLATAPAGFELTVRKTGPPENPPEPLAAPSCSRRLHLLNCVFRD